MMTPSEKPVHNPDRRHGELINSLMKGKML